jgi:hypothetical protein
MKKTFLFAIIAFLFAGCKDDEMEVVYYDTYIDGYITDYHTGEPISGITFDVGCSASTNVGGMGIAGYGSYYEINSIATTNSQGYYKIHFPKTIDGDVMKVITLLPHCNNPNYSFDVDKRIEYEYHHISTQSKKIDVRAISFGFLKVIAPLNYTYSIKQYFNSYEMPLMQNKIIIDTIILYKETLYKVPATIGTLYNGVYREEKDTLNFNIEPKDTLIIDLTSKK